MNIQQVLIKIVEVFNTGNISEVNSLVSPNYIDHQKPKEMNINGPEEFKQIVMLARESMPDLRVTIEDCIVAVNKIAGRLRWDSVDKNGQNQSRETIEILRFDKDLVIEHWGAEEWSTALDHAPYS